MKIKEYKNLVLDRSNDFLKDNTLGIVMKLPDDIKQNVYGIYIPRIMMGVVVKDGPFEKVQKLSSGKCFNSNNSIFGEDEIIYSNYILLTMDTIYNLSMPKLILGENVTIGIIDQDINSMYIKPFCRDQILNRPDDVMQMYVPSSGKYDGEDLTDKNTYYIKLDSQNKIIRLHMSNSNGEVSEYDLTINGSDGLLTMTDGKRSFIINTKNDEVTLSNEAKTIVALRGDTVDISCKKYLVNAEDSIEFTSKKFITTIDDKITFTTKEFEGALDTMKIKGDKLVEDYTKTEITNKTRKVTSNTTTVDGLMEVSDWLNANGGIGFGALPGKAPLPVNAQITGKGIANFAGAPGMPLVKGTPLLTLLTAIAAQADAAGSAGPAIVPPTASIAVQTLGQMITSTTAKG